MTPKKPEGWRPGVPLAGFAGSVNPVIGNGLPEIRERLLKEFQTMREDGVGLTANQERRILMALMDSSR